MAPKKKSVQASPKKKVAVAKKATSSDKVAGEKKPKDDVSAKIVSPKVKEPVAVVTSPNKSKAIRIYENPDFQKPLNYPPHDLIKILTRNPLEAYIFWNILPGTFQKCLDFFQSQAEHIQLEIHLEYNSLEGDKQTRIIQIHPLSTNYYCQFPHPVNHLKAALFAVQNGRTYLLFHSAQVSLPSEKVSMVWDENWAHPEWIEKGYLIKGADGKYYLKEGFQPENFVESYFDGSSGLLTSSRALGSSNLSSSRALGSSEVR
jgi:hypothetical protein